MIKKICLLGTFASICACHAGDQQGVSKEPVFEFGVMADCQYADKPTKGKRRYRLSKDKLKESVESYNKLNLDFVIHLGDFIDEQESSFTALQSITSKLKAPLYHVLGNHDYSVADERKIEIPNILKMKSSYYDFTIKNWRMIVLNGNDISFYAHPKNSEKSKEAAEYYKKNKLKAPKWNGAIGDQQLKWLENKLIKATADKENVILFCHFPIWPTDRNHMLWNSQEVLALVEKYPTVKIWLNGHNHNGAYAEKNGIHYLTLKGMLDTEENAFSVIKVYNDKLEIKGNGRQKDQIIKIK